MNNINTYSLELDENRCPVLKVKESFSYASPKIGTPKDAADLANSCFRLKNLAEEHAEMIALNTKGYVLGMFEVSHGSVNSAYCDTREFFLRALVVGATGIVVLHNHPSGESCPSDTDIETFKKINEAGKLMGIRLLDFIIVATVEYNSFKEGGRL
jgi:DNA repair protein RadC